MYKNDKYFYTTIGTLLVIGIIVTLYYNKAFYGSGGFDMEISALIIKKENRYRHLKDCLSLQFQYKGKVYTTFESGIQESIYDRVNVGDSLVIQFNHTYPMSNQIRIKK